MKQPLLCPCTIEKALANLIVESLASIGMSAKTRSSNERRPCELAVEIQIPNGSQPH